MRRFVSGSMVVAGSMGLVATTVAASSPPDASSGTRIVETMQGPVEIPIEPDRITVLDEYAGMSLLAFGVVPDVVYGSFGSVVGQEVLSAAGAEVRPMAGFGAPNLEDVSSTEPDLILYSSEGAYLDIYEELTAIAPSVELPYSVPWRDAITAVGGVVGQDDEAARLIAIVEGEIATLAESVAADPMSISILGDTYGMVFAASMTSPLSSVVAEAGFDRPEAELNGQPDPTFDSAVMISTETLGEHDADVVAVLSGEFYEERTFLDAPTFQALSAVQDGRSVVVDGDLWFGTYPFAISWLLEDLAAVHEAFVAGEDVQAGVGDGDDVTGRWEAFEALIAAE